MPGIGTVITVLTTAKEIHNGLYEKNDAYKQTADRTVNDAVGGIEFARRCAADWWMWRTTGVEDGGRNPYGH